MTTNAKTYTKQQQRTIQAALSDPLANMRKQVKDSLYCCVRYFWPEYTEDEFVDNWHIKLFCDELETIARRVAEKKTKLYDLIVNVPPGTSKTSVVLIIFPVWCWINWYWMRFITGSHTSILSLESAEYSRDIIRSERFRQLFPEIVIKQDKDQKSNFRVVKKEYVKAGRAPRLKQGGGRVSTSVGGTIIGFHGHINLIDDPLDPKRAASDVEIKNANKWVSETISTRKTDKKVTPIILIMQRLHQNDPTGHLLAKKGKLIKHICLPGEIRTPEYRALVKPQELIERYVDDLLDANRMDWEALRMMQTDLGTYGYSSQVGQNPVPPGDGMFKCDNFQYIDKVPGYDNVVGTVRYWDKAGTVDGGAYTVGVKIHKLKNGRFVVSDVKRGQWGTEVRERIILQTAEADEMQRKENPVEPPVQVFIEQEPGSGGKESADATVKNLAGFSIYKDRPTGDKIFRADPYSVQVNNGNVMLVRAEWNAEYVEELRFFPFSTYKDQVDASSGAFSKLVLKRVAGNPLK